MGIMKRLGWLCAVASVCLVITYSWSPGMVAADSPDGRNAKQTDSSQHDGSIDHSGNSQDQDSHRSSDQDSHKSSDQDSHKSSDQDSHDSHDRGSSKDDSATWKSCTPGFWKNHTTYWGPSGYSPNQSVGSVFAVPVSLDKSLATSSLLQGLSFKGGSTLSGAASILLRSAIAALINAGSLPSVTYPLTPAQVISQTNAALAKLDRGAILNLATLLDNYNNGSCQATGANLSVTISPAIQLIDYGAVAMFKISVTNAGPVALTGVAISDPTCTSTPGTGNTSPNLAKAATISWTCTATNVTAAFTSTVTATSYQTVPHPASANVIVRPLITASATVGNVGYTAGTWANQPVKVSFACTDTGNGIKSCTAPTTIATNTANLSVSGTATDNLGNSSSTTFGPIDIDMTPPVVNIAGVQNSAYYSTTVTPTVSITDLNLDSSGTVITLNGQPYVSGTPITAEGTYTLSASGADLAGNTSSQIATFTIDKTPPVVTDQSWGPYWQQVGGVWQAFVSAKGTATDNTRLASVTYELHGPLPSRPTSDQTKAGYGPIFASVTGTIAPDLLSGTYGPVQVGKLDFLAPPSGSWYYWRVVAYDAAGNEGFYCPIFSLQ